MTQTSKIEWTQATWNPTTGCTKISHGCKHCYAERLSKRLCSTGILKYKKGFQLTVHEDTLTQPQKWKKGKIIFVNSMSDLFHKKVPDDFIIKVFRAMEECPQHQFQVLTKRPSRVLEMNKKLPWAKNVWMGTSVESERWLDRLNYLTQTNAQIKFLSLEPLLGPLPNLSLNNIDWVIVGGESGPGARQMQTSWVETIHKKCIKSNTPFFFKQWGGVFKKKMGRTFKNQTWDEMPDMAI